MIRSGRIIVDPVPYADTDASGYVHHSRIVEYMERGRVDLFKRNGATIALANQYGFYMATSEVSVKFLHVIKHGDTIQVNTTVKHINSYRIKTVSEICLVDTSSGTFEVCADGQNTTVFVDHEMIPRQLPEDVRQGRWTPERLVELAKEDAIKVIDGAEGG